MIQIKNRFTGAVLYEIDLPTVRGAVESAIKNKISLCNADLSNAILCNADLSNAILCNANLCNAYLRHAYLRDADLYNANLSNADLRNAILHNADLYKSNLRNANLRNADLYNANLSNADLSNAILRNADLRKADLRNADLRNADLRNAKNSDLIMAQNKIVPEGQLIVWKKLRGGIIAKLMIPQGADRINALGSRKCRASYAFVLELSGNRSIGLDLHTGEFEYKLGEFVYPDKFDNSPLSECSSGIHFFLTRIEAENY